MSSAPPRLALLAATSLLVAGCAGMTRTERGVTSGLLGAASVAGGVLLVGAQSDCSGNSEDPNACTFGDHGRDFAAVAGGTTLILGGAALLVASVYLLTR